MRSIHVVTFITLFALVIGLVSQASHVQSAPQAEPASNTPFGVNSHLASRYGNYELLDEPLERLVATDTGWVREEFVWSLVDENRTGDYDWGFLDKVVNDLTAQGVNIIGLLNDTPGNPPPDPQQFAAFASAAVARYPQIRHWQVWNEPENPTYWSPRDPAAYTRLLQTVYPAIKNANPDAQVVLGGIVPYDLRYFREILDLGAWDFFDVVAVHPYLDPAMPESGQIGRMGINSVESLVDARGGKPIWATEFGWATGPSSRAPSGVSEDDQASLLVRSMVLVHSSGADRTFWYTLKDDPGNPYGLFRWGGGQTDYSQPKPSYTAFQVLNDQLGWARFVSELYPGGRPLLFDFEDFGTWTVATDTPGTATFTQSGEHLPENGCCSSAQLSYNFPNGDNDYVVVRPQMSIEIPGNSTRIGLWAKGDGSSSLVKVWLEDATGEILQYRLGPVSGGDWQFLTASLTGQAGTENRINQGGNNDGRLDLPATLHALALDDHPDNFTGQGTVFIDDLTAIVGPEVYQMRYDLNGADVDVIWSVGYAGSVSIPTSSLSGQVIDRDGAERTINSLESGAGRAFPLDLQDGRPVYLVHQGTPTEPQPPVEVPVETTQVPQPTTPPDDGSEEEEDPPAPATAVPTASSTPMPIVVPEEAPVQSGIVLEDVSIGAKMGQEQLPNQYGNGTCDYLFYEEHLTISDVSEKEFYLNFVNYGPNEAALPDNYDIQVTWSTPQRELSSRTFSSEQLDYPAFVLDSGKCHGLLPLKIELPLENENQATLEIAFLPSPESGMQASRVIKPVTFNNTPGVRGSFGECALTTTWLLAGNLIVTQDDISEVAKSMISVAVTCPNGDSECVAKAVAVEWVKYAGEKIISEGFGVVYDSVELLTQSEAQYELLQQAGCYKVSTWISSMISGVNGNGARNNSILTESPVYPLVINSQGQRTGFLADGKIVEEIPGSRAETIGERRLILYEGTDIIKINVVGYNVGTMNVHTVLAQEDNSSIAFSYENVEVTQGMRASLSSDDSSYTLRMDMDGDGVIDQTRAPDQIEHILSDGSIQAVQPPASTPQTSTLPNTAIDPEDFASQTVQEVWEYTDLPVRENRMGSQPRSWIWGPEPLTKPMLEMYEEAPNGQRVVQYFDKGRIELNDLAEGIVSSGFLTIEMIEGRVRVGENTHQDYEPADIPVAGDPAATNPDAPTYRSFRNVVTMLGAPPAPDRSGQLVTDVLSKDGQVTSSPELERYDVRFAKYSSTYGHNVPDVFLDFFVQQGIVYENGRYQQGRIMDSWLFVVGLPISEPYWATVQVGGEERLVLMQAFQRRILTYSPDNSSEWRVEMGNTGQHYLDWRYSR
jgi:hypothetical protein